MPEGRIEAETFWGYGTVSVTTKPPRRGVSRAPENIYCFWKLYNILGEKNNNFLEIISQREKMQLMQVSPTHGSSCPDPV